MRKQGKDKDMPITRRELLGIPLTFALAGMSKDVIAEERKKVATIITEYRPKSHADVIVGRMLNGYYYKGKQFNPRFKVVSMYTDQVPDNDMSREQAAKHNVPIYKTIAEALTMGGKDLAVEGVVIVGEHGNYPWNEKGQHLYPRYEFFQQVVDVFRETGKSAPVFTDKHFSYDWDKAKWMYDQSRKMGFLLMAGSSLPLTRAPEQEFEKETPIEKAVVTWQGTQKGAKDSYGFHALERLQSIVERRKGGETGIAAVQCFEGNPVWAWTDANPWAGRLLNAVVNSPKSTSGSLHDIVTDPILFILEYRDGFQAAVYRMNRLKSSRSFAAYVRGKSDPVFEPNPEGVTSPIAVPEQLRSRYPYNHFSAQVYFIEQMILHNLPPNPVERTLLTTGALAALFDSSYQNGRNVEKGRRVETPHLKITYRIS
ncbi:hypothetical protein ACFL1R_08790 [Candidatus Latescibacterota bacterium]